MKNKHATKRITFKNITVGLHNRNFNTVKDACIEALTTIRDLSGWQDLRN